MIPKSVKNAPAIITTTPTNLRNNKYDSLGSTSFLNFHCTLRCNPNSGFFILKIPNPIKISPIIMFRIGKNKSNNSFGLV
jgi:hypothetical protein